VIGAAAVLLKGKGTPGGLGTAEPFPFVLRVRLAIGLDAETVLSPTLQQFVSGRRLATVATARQGLSIDATYNMSLRQESSASALVNALNRLEGVQNVELQRTDAQEG
jgi:hypothetical protein